MFLFAIAFAAEPTAPLPPPEVPAPLPAVAVPAETLPGFWSFKLDNGMSVSVMSDMAMPVVATQLWVTVGSAHETDVEAGFAHLFEHLMFGATSTYGKDAYSQHHTRNGGSENAYTMFDNTVYISEIGPSVHDQVLVFEADRFQNLVLDQANLDNEKKIVTEELRLRTENDPFSRLLNPALKGLFGEHPYGHSPAGTKEDLAAADLELVRKFYSGYYAPPNMHLVVVGPVDGPATITRIQALFGGIQKQAVAPPEVAPLTSLATGQRVALQEDLPPIKVAAQVYWGPRRSDPDWWAWSLMSDILAGGELDRFREILVTDWGKAVEAATVSENLRAGSILAFASVNLPFRSEGKAFKLLDKATAELELEGWITEENLATARRRALQSELYTRFTASGMADAIGMAWAWQGDASLPVRGQTAAIDAVTLDQVKEVWRRYVAQVDPVELWLTKGKAGGAE